MDRLLISKMDSLLISKMVKLKGLVNSRRSRKNSRWFHRQRI